jgi:serine/threonine protein kinase
MLRPGDVLGEFVLGPALAEGPTGTLHAGQRRRDGLTVAVRVVPPELVRDDAHWNRFIETAREVWHRERRHIAPVVGHGTLSDGHRFVAFGLAEGRTLAELLAEHPLEPAEVLSMLRGVCRALEAAHHHGVFHGALSSASVCMGSDHDGQLRARVLELGSSVLLDAGPPRSGAVPKDGATPPAEVARDLRALGVLCFESLTGSPFVEGSDDAEASVSDLRPELGPHFDEPVSSMITGSAKPASAADAHARLVQAARRAGYDVGNAIPAAPREARDDSRTGARTATKPKARPKAGWSDVAGVAGPALFVLALLALAFVLLRSRG